MTCIDPLGTKKCYELTPCLSPCAGKSGKDLFACQYACLAQGSKTSVGDWFGYQTCADGCKAKCAGTDVGPVCIANCTKSTCPTQAKSCEPPAQ